MKRYKTINLIISGVLAGLPLQGVLAAENCQAVREVHINWPEVYDGHGSQNAFVKKTIVDALREAVQEGVGLEIGDFNSMNSSMSDSGNESGDHSTYMQKVHEIAYQRVNGFILSYNIGSETWRRLPRARKQLTIRLNATVCAPYASALPEIVAVGSFKWQSGRDDPEAAQIAAAAIPVGPQIVLSSRGPGRGYHDVLITGRLIGPTVYTQNRSQEVAAVSRYFGQYAVQGVAANIRRMRLTVVVNATFIASQEKVSKVATVVLPINGSGARANVTRELVDEAIRRAMPALAGKIIAFKNE